MIEKVKEILKEMCLYTSRLGECGSREQCPNVSCKFADEYASKICDLEPKPDEGRLLTSRQMRDAIVGAGYSTAFGNVSIAESVAKAQDAKTASIKDAEFDTKIRNEVRRQAKKRVKLVEYYSEKLDEKDAECQERVERILDGIENPYPSDSNSPDYKTGDIYRNITFDEAIQAVKQALKKKEEK